MLSASFDGSSQMVLSLDTLGQRTETQTNSGATPNCQWAGADEVAHQISSGACWRPTVWFLPAVSLQPSLMPSNVGSSDLGVSAVGSDGNLYRHLQTLLLVNAGSDDVSAQMADLSSTDIGFFANSFLPAVLAYCVPPDNGDNARIPIEVHFGNYQTVNGVQIPFVIQRYVNGSLQLEIHVTSVAVS